MAEGNLESSLNAGVVMIPENQNCVYSMHPERLWCTKLGKPALIGVCRDCTKYELRDDKQIYKNHQNKPPYPNFF